MLRSIVKDDANEFEIIREKEHVAKVYEAILKRFDQYYESWLAKSDTSLAGRVEPKVSCQSIETR